MATVVELPKVGMQKEVVGNTAKLTVTEAKEDLFITEAADVGIDVATLKKVADFTSKYAATVVALGVEKAGEELKAHKSYTDVELTYPFGVNKNDKITIKVDREKTYRNPSNGEASTAPGIKVAISSKFTNISKSFIRKEKQKLTDFLAG